MKNKRDLWMVGATSLVIAVVFFVATGAGTRRQQKALVDKLDDDIFHGRSQQVKQLVTETDVVAHVPAPGNFLTCGVLYCDPQTVEVLIKKALRSIAV